MLKNNKGFSMVELFISISILAIITSFSVINFNTWEKNENLRQSARLLDSNIHSVQAKSLSGEMFNGVSPSGYGAYFSNIGDASYILFADLDNDYTYDAADGEFIDTYNLTNNVLISDLTPISANGLTIVFKLPNAKIYINQNILSDSGKIELTHSITTNSKITEIRRITGRIDTQ
ncbi:prepilin-type N-terminal cleavage/methylation domain-containing protein [Candidatus Parcubacteria bacterium]|nr:prepilin-type N-terminal cleavage/methylation domain-containing protein [Candidatus Parcubacteria bacterium]